MWSARTGSALALAAFLCGTEAPDAVLRRTEPGQRAPEELWEVCLGCIGVYPGACLPVAVCEPDIRLTVPQVEPVARPAIEAEESSLPVD